MNKPTMMGPMVLTPQKQLELAQIARRLAGIFNSPVAQLQLGPVMMAYNEEMKDDEIIVTVISSTYKYMTTGERYKAAWGVLAKAWPDLMKTHYINLNLMSDEEWITFNKHMKMVQEEAT